MIMPTPGGRDTRRLNNLLNKSAAAHAQAQDEPKPKPKAKPKPKPKPKPSEKRSRSPKPPDSLHRKRSRQALLDSEAAQEAPPAVLQRDSDSEAQEARRQLTLFSPPAAGSGAQGPGSGSERERETQRDSDSEAESEQPEPGTRAKIRRLELDLELLELDWNSLEDKKKLLGLGLSEGTEYELEKYNQIFKAAAKTMKDIIQIKADIATLKLPPQSLLVRGVQRVRAHPYQALAIALAMVTITGYGYHNRHGHTQPEHTQPVTHTSAATSAHQQRTSQAHITITRAHHPKPEQLNKLKKRWMDLGNVFSDEESRRNVLSLLGSSAKDFQLHSSLHTNIDEIEVEALPRTQETQQGYNVTIYYYRNVDADAKQRHEYKASIPKDVTQNLKIVEQFMEQFMKQKKN